jgi:hypothetical protein
MPGRSQSVLATMASRVAFTLAIVGVEGLVVAAYIDRFEQAAGAVRVTSMVVGGGLFLVCSAYWLETPSGTCELTAARKALPRRTRPTGDRPRSEPATNL